MTMTCFWNFDFDYSDQFKVVTTADITQRKKYL